jgi:hypothetical protein
MGTVRVAAPVEAAFRATAGATTGQGPGSKPKQACHMLSAIDQSARRPCWLALYSLSEHHYYHWVTGTHASIRPLGTANTHGRHRGPRIHTNCDAETASRSFRATSTYNSLGCPCLCTFRLHTKALFASTLLALIRKAFSCIRVRHFCTLLIFAIHGASLGLQESCYELQLELYSKEEWQ